MKQKYIPAILLAVLILVQLACSSIGPTATPDTVATLNGLYTAAAQTATVAAGGQPGNTATPGLPMPTASPILVWPTSTPFVLATNTPRPVALCDAAAFVKDVSYEDGSVLARGSSFTKTWRLKNVGTCAWTPSYALVFVSGDAMSGPSAVALGSTIQPGQTIDVSASMIAPSTDGHFRGYWKLRNASGALFGIGARADTAFWVDIYAKGPSYVAYDFAARYCEADWENNDSLLPCPGVQDSEDGYAIRLDAPRMENGAKSDEPGLLTFPEATNSGFITGTFPAFTVQNGDRFRALVTCKYNAERCNVIFKLQFKSEGQLWTLGTWNEAYEGRYFPVDISLNSVAGRRGKLILVVLANGSPREDEALWITPRLIRNGNPPPVPTKTQTSTPTSTATFTPTSTATSTPTSTG